MFLIYFNTGLFITLVLTYLSSLGVLIYKFYCNWWFWLILLLLGYIINFCFVVYLQLTSKFTAYNNFWMWFQTFLPGFVLVTWFFYGKKYQYYGTKRWWKKYSEKLSLEEKNFNSNQSKDYLKKFPIQTQRAFQFAKNLTYHEYTNEYDTDLIFSHYQKIKLLERDLLKAKKFIYINYYIFNKGEILNWFIDLLIKIAKNKIKIYIIYDFFGNYGNKNQLKLMRQAGIKFADRGKKYRHGNLFYVNHRKNIVIDGEIAYMGGFNIGDPHANLSSFYGYWVDSHVRLTGLIVNSISIIFLKNWYMLNHNELPLLLNEYQKNPKSDIDKLAIVIDKNLRISNPILKHLFMRLISLAQDKVLIYTPYFFLDEMLIQTLVNTALSGIKVEIYVPGFISIRMAVDLGRLYYDRLLDAGVKIYEFENVYLHAKVILIDDSLATIGSCNLDFHSFYYSSEEVVLFHDSALVKKLAYNLSNENKASFNLIKTNPLNNKPWYYRLILKFFKISELFY